jgi:sulfite reductase alpha subunit-like flavoprotein
MVDPTIGSLLQCRFCSMISSLMSIAFPAHMTLQVWHAVSSGHRQISGTTSSFLRRQNTEATGHVPSGRVQTSRAGPL